MDRIGIVGLSWRLGGPEAVARFTLPPETRAARLPEIARAVGARELVYLATCNRVEVAFAVERPAQIPGVRRALHRALTGTVAAPGEAERELKAWAGEGAAEHLFLVATGLDSARLGETEIAGQLRGALDEARALGLAGRRLDPLIEEALKVARRVRQATGIGDGRTSLAEIALDRVRARLAEQRGAAEPAPVALVGVSAMTRRCAQELIDERAARVLVLNRTPAKAEELARELGPRASAYALADFLAAPEAVSALVTATSAEQPVFAEPELVRLAEAASDGTLPLLVDLAVPPDVDAAAARRLGFELAGMDEILAQAQSAHAQRAHERGEARALIDDALASLRKRWSARAIDSAAVALREHYKATALKELERLLRRDLKELGEPERASLRGFAELLAQRFAHLPTRGLRAVAVEAGGDALEAFFRGADAELSRQLSEALERGAEGLHVPTIEDPA